MSRHTSFVRIAALAAASFLLVRPAPAADLLVKARPAPAPAPSMWDIAFGALIASDYNFRGVSQSDRGPSVGAYVEPRFKIAPNVELYAGIAGYSTKLPTEPTGEFDFYGGVRLTAGPVSFDFGGLYYYYPREVQQFTDFATVVTSAPLPGLVPLTVSDTDFAEVYGKASWTVNDVATVGGYIYYADSFLNSGATGLYSGGTLKLTAPSAWFPADWGAYVSAEVAHYWLGTTDAVLGNVDLPDYTYWNAGVGVTWKMFTLDLRYHDTDLSQTQCFLLTGDPRGVTNGGFSRWCSETFVARLSIDTTLAAFK